MNAEALVVSLLAELPQQKLNGRTRLQKLSYFVANSGASDIKFFLHNYGPFSAELAAATDSLALWGEIEEKEEAFGPLKRFRKVYSLKSKEARPEPLPKSASAVLKVLNEYQTMELEIAATIHFFMSRGMSIGDAISETRRIKPMKSDPQIIKRAQEALTRAGLYERGRADQVPSSRSHQF